MSSSGTAERDDKVAHQTRAADQKKKPIQERLLGKVQAEIPAGPLMIAPNPLNIVSLEPADGDDLLIPAKRSASDEIMMPSLPSKMRLSNETVSAPPPQQPHPQLPPRINNLPQWFTNGVAMQYPTVSHDDWRMIMNECLRLRSLTNSFGGANINIDAPDRESTLVGLVLSEAIQKLQRELRSKVKDFPNIDDAVKSYLQRDKRPFTITTLQQFISGMEKMKEILAVVLWDDYGEILILTPTSTKFTNALLYQYLPHINTSEAVRHVNFANWQHKYPIPNPPNPNPPNPNPNHIPDPNTQSKNSTVRPKSTNATVYQRLGNNNERAMLFKSMPSFDDNGMSKVLCFSFNYTKACKQGSNCRFLHCCHPCVRDRGIKAFHAANIEHPNEFFQ
ncbi:hypothetical protein BCR33DRAFT_854234 [Rhizoclosmatium globosum]|uniref:C3H1-type domain-containing protein n=1 Tax=Rhizoclosmatium globosum TaxID=329046 RepID=A0A1Y2BTU7_9FUNG|nr:hypothetical protein BCR33DRAFT_854234 [Rhizoclosmatium globosum]|eukprot:ORY38057.1 hypothetical protein BCR33DRAFT_854234 [Rhizoclosmatium globosum]